MIGIFHIWSCFTLSSEHLPMPILLRIFTEFLSPFCRITSVNSTITNNDHKLKKSPNPLLSGSNIWGALIGVNCNKSPTTGIDKFANGWLSEQPNISHNLLCICNKQILETIEISSISTTNTSEYKFLSLPRSESKALVKYIH